MSGSGRRAEIILPVVFHDTVPLCLRETAVLDWYIWVNVLVGVIPYFEDVATLTQLNTVDHLRNVSVNCALEALFGSPQR